MLISVIIPAYNSEKYIKFAIESVLNQTYQDFEIIIVDDGSTDNTQEIINNINDNRIKYIYQENAGPSVARNNGIQNAQGEYIAFLDADDAWYPEKLELQINAFKQSSNISLVYTALEMESEGISLKEIKRFRNYNSNEDLIKFLLFNPIAITPAVMIKKTYLEKTGLFDNELNTGEDWDLWLKLASIDNFYYIDKVLVKTFRPKSSITSTISIHRTEECHTKILNSFFNNNKEMEKYKYLKPKTFSYVYFVLANLHFYRYRPNPPMKEVFRCFFKSLSLAPLNFITSYQRSRFTARIFAKFLFRI